MGSAHLRPPCQASLEGALSESARAADEAARASSALRESEGIRDRLGSVAWFAGLLHCSFFTPPPSTHTPDLTLLACILFSLSGD